MKDPDWMPDGEWARLRNYVARLLPLMGLSHWRVELLREPTDPLPGGPNYAVADTHWVPGRRAGSLRVCHGWGTIASERKRLFIVHELVHAHVADMHETVRQLDGLLGGPAYNALWVGWMLAFEHAVDGLSEVIAPLMPPYPGPDHPDDFETLGRDHGDSGATSPSAGGGREGRRHHRQPARPGGG